LFLLFVDFVCCAVIFMLKIFKLFYAQMSSAFAWKPGNWLTCLVPPSCHISHLALYSTCPCPPNCRHCQWIKNVI